MFGSLKMVVVSAFAFVAVYWLFVVIMRSTFGVELPDPADQLPYAWRSHIPRTF
jgi:hypothetical protein